MIRIKQFVGCLSGKVLVALWAMTTIVLLMTPIVTWISNREELLGNISFIILISSLMINVSIVLVTLFQSRGAYIAKAMWIGLCYATLLLVIGITDPNRPDTIKDAGTVLSYLMLTLSFPIGFLGVIFLIGLNQIFSIGEAGPYMSTLFSWLLLSVFGYVQWFIVFPFFVNRIRKS